MRTIRFAALAAAFIVASTASALALNAQSGMPREPKTASGMCAKASQGYHIPYRGWHTRNLLGYRTCMWPFWTAAFSH